MLVKRWKRRIESDVMVTVLLGRYGQIILRLTRNRCGISTGLTSRKIFIYLELDQENLEFWILRNWKERIFLICLADFH